MNVVVEENIEIRPGRFEIKYGVELKGAPELFGELERLLGIDVSGVADVEVYLWNSKAKGVAARIGKSDEKIVSGFRGKLRDLARILPIQLYFECLVLGLYSPEERVLFYDPSEFRGKRTGYHEHIHAWVREKLHGSSPYQFSPEGLGRGEKSAWKGIEDILIIKWLDEGIATVLEKETTYRRKGKPFRRDRLSYSLNKRREKNYGGLIEKKSTRMERVMSLVEKSKTENGNLVKASVVALPMLMDGEKRLSEVFCFRAIAYLLDKGMDLRQAVDLLIENPPKKIAEMLHPEEFVENILPRIAEN